MISVRTRRDIADASSQVRAFVFLWVNWAIQARESRRLVDAVVEGWNTERSDLAAPYYIADVSEQCGEVWDGLVEWLEAERRPAGHLLISGVGPLIWVHNGRVAAHVFPLTLDLPRLERATQNIWA